jgi:hypothetical protein
MIVTGNASSQVTVDTQVQGRGSTYTYIETEANGEKKVFETDQPGKYEVKIEASPTVSFEASPEPSPEPSPPKEEIKIKTQSKWQMLINRIKEKWTRFFAGFA